MIKHSKCTDQHIITIKTRQILPCNSLVQVNFTRKTDLKSTPLLSSMPYLSVLAHRERGDHLKVAGLKKLATTNKHQGSALFAVQVVTLYNILVNCSHKISTRLRVQLMMYFPKAINFMIYSRQLSQFFQLDN